MARRDKHDRQYKKMNRFFCIVALIAVAGCKTAAEKKADEDRIVGHLLAAQGIKPPDPTYGECPRDGWKSASVIGKSTSKELIRQLKACGVWGAVETSSYVTARGETLFVHWGAETMWHFQNGVLVSYKR